MLPDGDGFLDISERDRYVLLYVTSPWSLGDTLSLAFDFHTSTATFIADYNDCVDICKHDWSWLPLEDILEGYVKMIDKGKVTLVRITFLSIRTSRIPVAASAMKHLVDAIEARIDRLTQRPALYDHLLWHDPTAFPEELAPPVYIRPQLPKSHFRTQGPIPLHRPRHPVPTLNEFLNQPYLYGRQPLQILQIETTDDTPLDPPEHGILQYIGMHIQMVDPGGNHHSANEFRLELPFRIGANGYARQSDGKPLGVNIEQSQPVHQGSRSDLGNWAEMVERGSWEVGVDGVDGVAGEIEKFTEADTEEPGRSTVFRILGKRT
ncbi:hypothetical protein BDW59DRAFT_160432 [Aspergillus cavernicola]|uniref:Uncharacterized protein n=1 Tax=Aspergillus cavernicola TaxID=176166 RepID=A0ABR4IHB3_9EURO